MKLRKFNKTNRLNEDDQNTQQQTTAAPATNTQAQPAAPAQPVAQPAAPTQPAAQNNAPQQPTQPAPAQQQQTQQSAQQQPADPTAEEKKQKTNQFLEGVRNNVKENKIYWAIATDFVKEIQDNIPDFKADNQAAKPGIDAWEAFKKEPGEATFNTFMDALSAFAAPQQPQQTPEQAQQAQALQDSVVLDFGNRLEERLRERVIFDKVASQIEQGIYEARHK